MVSVYDRVCVAKSRSSQLDETIPAPIFAADAVVPEEEPRRIVFVFHGPKPAIVPVPAVSLPTRIEVIAFGNIGPGIRHQPAQRRRRGGDSVCILVLLQQVPEAARRLSRTLERRQQ